MVLVLIFLGIGIFIWYRVRRRGLRLPVNPNSEEHIPLNASINRSRPDLNDDDETFRQRKGKERATEPKGGSPIFDVGDSDEEEEEGYRQNGSRDV